MKKLILFAAATPLALAACSGGEESADADGDGEITGEEARAQARNIRMEPGEWEVTTRLTEIDSPGMPEAAREMMREQMGRSTTYNHCITPEQAANPEGEMFGGEDEQNCTYSEFTMSGGNILVEATCQPEGMGGEMTMRMEGSYTPREYDMTMGMTTTGTPMGDMTMSGETTGRRIGECSEEGGE
ncbi:MAG: DUF3617 domain-containing protein [Parasphingopyxis sp.]|nr:DUF3617 domain-containing protein [Sphingomonadales bacterium]